MTGLLKRATLIFVSAACVLVAAEGLLRAVGFRYEIKPEQVEFGWPNPATRRALYEVDADLFWVPADYRMRLAAIAERLPRRPDLILLGDSCTEFSDYPERLEQLLGERHPEAAPFVEQLAVGGWSTYQGLQQLQRDILPLEPSAVLVYFGWNDHWMGFGVEDAQIHSVAWGGEGLQGLRLTQLLRRALLGIRSGESATLRVSEIDFRRNLQAMARLSRAAGVIPILVTAPSAHERGAEPEKLLERHLRDLEQLVPLHQRYVQIVREVAKAERSALCDLAASYASMPAEVRRADFTSDGIHLSRSGSERVAGLLQECFGAHEALPAVLR